MAAVLKLPFRRRHTNLHPPLLRLLHSPTAASAAAAEEILSILETVDHAEGALALERAVPHLSPSIAAAVIEQQRDRALGFRFFVWASRWKRLRSHAAANTVIDSLVADDEDGDGFELYWRELERARETGLSVGPYAFMVLIKGFDKAGLTEKALESFERMKEEFGCDPDLPTYNTVLRLLLKKRVFVMAMTVYNGMLKLGVSPNVVTYNTMFGGLCKSLRIDDALRMFDEMSERGLAPDTATYNIMISGLFRAKRVDEALRLFHSMAENGLAPDSHTRLAVLNGYCRLGMVGEAYSFLSRSKDEGFEMGPREYNSLISGLFRARRSVEGRGWYRKMIGAGIRPDAVLYSTVIRWLVDEGRVPHALGLLEEMSRRGVAPDSHCYAAVVGGLCEAGRVDEALSLHRKISSRRRRQAAASTVTYTVLLHGLCRNGRVQEAAEVFEEMEGRGFPPSAVTYNALISGLCKAGDLRRARMLFYRMGIGKNPSVLLRLSRGGPAIERAVAELCESGKILGAYRLAARANDGGAVSPNARTYNSLVEGHCLAGDLDGALGLVKDMQIRGLSPDAVTYGTLIEGLQRVDREEDSFKVFNRMVKNGCKPDPGVYRSLMSWSCRRGNFSLALDLWLKDMHSRLDRDKDTVDKIAEHFKSRRVEEAITGLLEMDFKMKGLDLGPYSIFLFGLCQVGRIDDALTIFAALRERNVEITPPSCVKLIYDLCGKGRLDVAVSIFLYTLERGFVIRRPCNHLIKCLICDNSKIGVARDLVRKVDSCHVDNYIFPTTKILLGFHSNPP